MVAVVHAQWFALVAPHGAPDAVIEDELREVLTRYGEPRRHHHTVQHLQEVVGTVELLLHPNTELAGSARLLDDATTSAVRFAAWLHDVIYDPRAHDNEAASARYARRHLARLQVSPDIIEQTARLIMLTATHSVAADDRPAQVLIDADLAILGADPEAYDRYASAIRREYAHLDEETYRSGRTDVLQRFLDRPVLFHTARARERFEAPARRNLRRELEQLRTPAPETIA